VYDAPEESWNAVADALDQVDRKKGKSITIPLAYVWKIAMMMLLVTGIGLYLSLPNWKGSRAVSMSPDVIEASQYYNDMILLKVAKIDEIDQSVSSDVLNDMNLLDAAFNELKDDLNDNADNEEVVQAMMDTYKVKLQILEQILEQLQEKEEL
jgi:hypothetical protein